MQNLFRTNTYSKRIRFFIRKATKSEKMDFLIICVKFFEKFGCFEFLSICPSPSIIFFTYTILKRDLNFNDTIQTEEIPRLYYTHLRDLLLQRNRYYYGARIPTLSEPRMHFNPLDIGALRVPRAVTRLTVYRPRRVFKLSLTGVLLMFYLCFSCG